MDIDWYYYIAKKIVGLSDAEFWKSTPRKIAAFLNIELEEQGKSQNPYDDNTSYTPDQLSWL